MSADVMEAVESMRDVPVTIEARVDERLIEVELIAHLKPGTVIALQRPAGETLDVYVDNVRLASAEVVVIEDTLALRITEIEGLQG